MGLARVRKPEGLVSREVRSKVRSESAIRKCDSNRRDSQVRLTEFRQPLQVQSHLEVPRILVQLGHIQRT